MSKASSPPIRRIRLGERLQIAGLVATAIAMVLAGTGAFLWHERERLLTEADERAIHEVDRLAQDLERSLTVAEVAVQQLEEILSGQSSAAASQLWAPGASAHRAQLLSTLPLPFSLHTIGQDQHITELVGTRLATLPQTPVMDRGFLPREQLPADQWHVGQTVGEPLSQVIPLFWPARPNVYGVEGYVVDLSFLSVLARLDADRIRDGGGVALLRIAPGGQVSVLARTPFKEDELGQPVTGHVADVITRRAAGHFLTRGQFDGIERRVAFRRLTGTAAEMVVVHGVPTRRVLVSWYQRLPGLALVTAVLASVLLLGGWRLDRSVRRQQRAEAESVRRGETLERVFDVLQDMLFVLDRQGTFVHFQSGSTDLLYASPDQFLGRRIHEVMPPALSQLIMDRLTQAFDGPLQDFDYTLELPSGTHDFNARVARLPESEYCMVMARDITAQRQVQRDREHLNSFVVLLLEMATRFINLPQERADTAIHEGLAEMGMFTGMDRAYLFRYDFERTIITNTHEWCAPGITPQKDQLQEVSIVEVPDLAAAHRAGEIICIDDVHALPAGWLRDLLEPQQIRSLMMLPINTSRGCIGFIGFDAVTALHRFSDQEKALLRLFAQILSNTFERLMAEQSIAELTTALEARVADRTRALDASVRRLEELNGQLQAFSYSVSHDLKSPLRSVEGFATLLVEEFGDQVPPQARAYLERIRKSASHMAQLISDLLAYARLEQNEQSVETVALLPVVRSVLDGLANEIEQHQAAVEVDVPDRLCVRAAPGGLAMVLRNLIDNALKFTQAGKPPEIRLQARIPEGTSGTVLLSVVDQGQGFDMKHHDKIFSLFQRLHRADQVPGTGIGLAMVHKAITRMGGRIWAESAPGQGAQFHIELPLAVDLSANPSAADSAAGSAA